MPMRPRRKIRLVQRLHEKRSSQPADLRGGHAQLAARDRLEGWQLARFRLWPSFETLPRLDAGVAPQDEDRGSTDHDSNLENLL